MHTRRLAVLTALTLALVGYARRRAWWSYVGSSRHASPQRPAFVARRPAERLPYVARVTEDWRAAAERALPVAGTGLLQTGRDTLLPAAWIDAVGRPEVADLPRVARHEPLRSATQWLYDARSGRIVLVIVTIEPVSCSFAIAFDARRDRAALAAAAAAEQLALAFGPAPSARSDRSALVPVSSAGALLVLPLDAPGQLAAILERVTG